MEKSAVIFDIGGVLFSQPQSAIGEYADEIEVPRQLLAYAFMKGAPDNAFCRLERGERTLSQFFPEFEKEFVSIATERGVVLKNGFSARQLFLSISSKVKLHKDMLAAVTKLSRNGFKTCALTNNWIDDTVNHSAVRVSQFLAEWFDVVIESSKVGMRKPDKRIYQLACEKLNVNPTQVVFLDDIGANLKAAKKLGITTIKVTDTTLALRQLEEITNTRLIEQSKL